MNHLKTHNDIKRKFLEKTALTDSLLKQKNSFERHVDENGRMLKPKTAKIHFVAISFQRCTLCVLKKLLLTITFCITDF